MTIPNIVETVYDQKELNELLVERLNSVTRFLGSWFSPKDNLFTNQHEQIEIRGELSDIVRKDFIEKSFSPENVLQSAHVRIKYHGELIDVKMPFLAGWLVSILRPVGELLFNNAYTVFESPKSAMKREAGILEKLNSVGFPTFESRQYLMGENPVNRVLLTKYIENAGNVVKILKEAGNEKKLGIITEGTGLLNTLNGQNIIWGDPWYGNFVMNNDRMLLVDFGFLPNPKYPNELGFAKDFIGLAISGVYRSGMKKEEVVQAMLEAYNVKSGFKEAVLHSIESDKNAYNSRRFSGKGLFYNPFVTGLSEPKVMEIKEEIQKQIQ